MFVNTNEYGIRAIEKDDLRYAYDVLESRQLFKHCSLAENCSIVEQEISQRFDNCNAFLVSSGTAGIRAVLKCLDVGEGDFVAINAFTFIATASSVYSVGAHPIPVDFDPVHNISLSSLHEILKLKPKALIAVHWPGRCFNLSEIKKICDAHNIVLIEDACQAFAAQTEDSWAGCQGEVGIFSFQQNKLITCGEGGCIITKDRSLSQRISTYIDHGFTRDISGIIDAEKLIRFPGENLRLSEIQASILRGQLNTLDELLSKLAKNKSIILNQLKRFDIFEWPPFPGNDLGQSAFFLFADSDSANHAELDARSQNVLLRPLWPRAYYSFYDPYINDVPHFKSCPVAEAVAARIRILPIAPNLSEDDILTMCNIIIRNRHSLVQEL